MASTDPVPTGEPRSGAARPGRRDAVGVEIPVTVHASRTNQGLGKNLPAVHEDTRTVIVLQQGAVVRLTAALATGETVVLTNRMTGADVLCRVAKLKSQPGLQHYVDLEFVQRAPGFWGDTAAASSASVAAVPSAIAPAPSEPAAVPVELSPSPPVPAPASASVPVSPQAPVAVAAPPAPPPSPMVPAVDLPPTEAAKTIERAPLAEPVAVSWPERSVTSTRSGLNQSTLDPLTAEIGSDSASGSHKALLATAATVLLVLGGAAGGYWFYGRPSVISQPVPQPIASLPPVQFTPATEDPVATDFLPDSVSTPEPASQMDVVLQAHPTVDVAPARLAPSSVPAARTPTPLARRNTVPIGQLQAPKAKAVATPIGAGAPPPAIASAVSLGGPGAANPLLVAEPAGPAPPPVSSQPSIGGQLQPPQVVNSRAPVYPPNARRQRVQGVVVLDALVDETGKVAETKVISGPAPLLSAAEQAVRNWKYKPAQLNGKPIAVHTKVNVRFNLQ